MVYQYFGTEITGTVTFCLGGTGTGIRYGSGSGAGFGSGSNIKWNKKSIIKTESPPFWEIMLLLTLKRRDFGPAFCCC
jgi:hypothetical protein